MRKAEKTAVCLIVIGIIVKFFDAGAGNSIFIIGATLLAFIYFYFSFALFNNIRLRRIFKTSSYAGISGIRILGAIGAGMALSIIIIGILFKFLILPGAMEMLSVGLVFLSLIMLGLLVRMLIDKRSVYGYYKEIVSRTLPLLIIGVIFYLSASINFVKLYYRDQPELLDAWERYLENPRDSAAHEPIRSGADK